jgi:hypothetical protein
MNGFECKLSPVYYYTHCFVSTVNSVAWAPYSLGYPMLACASADGDISVLSYKGDTSPTSTSGCPHHHRIPYPTSAFLPYSFSSSTADLFQG